MRQHFSALQLVKEIDMSIDSWQIKAHTRACGIACMMAPSGDYAELGVYKGDTLRVCAQIQKLLSPGRLYYGFDCWQGLPFVGKEDGILSVGECRAKKEQVEDVIKINDLKNVRLIDGLIEETLTTENLSEVTFAFLDMDIYESTKFAAKYLMDIMPPASIIGFHDYGFHRTPGIKKCVDELDKRKWEQRFMMETVIFFQKL